MKTLTEYFRDWEGDAFGYGYGTGEPHILPLLKKFLELCNRGSYNHQYDYEILERELTPAVAWLLINILCHKDMLEYGTSPRFAWLTQKGKRLKEFVSQKSNEELIDIVCGHKEDYCHCYPTACNCGEHGYEEGLICQNPFWLDNVKLEN